MEASRAGKGATGRKRPTCNKRHWTEKEDELLTTLVNKHGQRSWDYIANHIRGRTGKSCRVRWVNQLDPKVDKTPFTEEERRKLIELHRKHGNKWSKIVKFFPGRTDNQVKNQYHVLMGTRHMKALAPSSSSDACGSSQSESVSTVPVGSQSSIACTGSSSVIGRDESCGRLGDSKVSDDDADSTATSKLSSLGQPQFFDFLGVGSSD